MMKYHARDVAMMDEQSLWGIPDGEMTLVFDDGVIQTYTRQTILSWYLWRVIRAYPKTPILMHHHIRDERLSSRTPLDILGRVFWDCYDVYMGTHHLEIEGMRSQSFGIEELRKANQKVKLTLIDDLCLLTYQAISELYNSLTYGLEEYVTTLSILDFIEILDHPTIAKANASLEPTQESISTVHKQIRTVLKDPKELIGNTIAESVKSNLLSLGQVMQCVSAVGYRTDVDSNIFREPILSSFTEGLTRLHDHAIESRSASKALMLTKDPLRVAEYFNRKLQLATATLQRINIGDCGSTTYMPFKVASRDLFALAGKYYKTDKGLKVVSVHDRSLVGQTIQMRSVFHCNDRDPAGVCSTCFGEIALSIPAETNWGHVSATVLCGKTTQNIMSTKHLDGSAEVDGIVLSAVDQEYIRTGDIANTLMVAKRLKGQSVKIILKPNEAAGLVDLGYTENVRALTIHNLTALTEVQFVTMKGRLQDYRTVGVSRDNRRSALSYEALEYVKKHGWTLTRDGNYQIDLTGWDVDVPLFKLPLKHLSTVDYVNSIEAKIIGLGKKSQNEMDMRPLSVYDTAEEALISLYELVSSKLSVNIAHLETIVYSTLIQDKEAPNHAPPLPGSPFVSAKYRDNMNRRSLSAQMAYQGQRATLYDPGSFIIDYRPPHVLDDFISP